MIGLLALLWLLMAAHDPERRRLAAVEAINTRWSRASKAERVRATEAMRAARRRQLEDQVDPDRRLDPDERDVMVQNLVRAELAKLARLGVAARAAKKQAQTDNALDELIATEASSS